jgi:hypothetical protein
MDKINGVAGLEFYACTQGHGVAVFVYSNTVAQHKKLGVVDATHIGNWVDAKIPHSKRVFERLERHGRFEVTTLQAIRAAVSVAKELVKSLEEDYGLSFLTGAEAFAERQRIFRVDK